MPMSNFSFADEEYPFANSTDRSNINIPKLRAWHPSDKVLDTKTQQSAFNNTTAPVSSPVPSPMPEQQDNLPAAMAKPSFGAFFKNLGKDKQSALGQAAMAAGFSLMSTPPSRYPISFGQQIGQAGMAGMQQYGSAMQNAREIEMQNKLFGLKERELAAQEPYYAARTKALLESPLEKQVTKLQMFNAAQKEVALMVKQFAPPGSNNAISLLAEDTDNYFANLQRQPALIDGVEKNIKASKDPYAWAKWQRLNEIRNEFLDVKIRQQEHLIGGDVGGDEITPVPESIPEQTEKTETPGVFRKAGKFIWEGLGKDGMTTTGTGTGTGTEKRTLPTFSDIKEALPTFSNVKEAFRKYGFLGESKTAEGKVVLPPEIKTTSEAMKYLRQQGMSEDEATNWLRSQ